MLVCDRGVSLLVAQRGELSRESEEPAAGRVAYLVFLSCPIRRPRRKSTNQNARCITRLKAPPPTTWILYLSTLTIAVIFGWNTEILTKEFQSSILLGQLYLVAPSKAITGQIILLQLGTASQVEVALYLVRPNTQEKDHCLSKNISCADLILVRCFSSMKFVMMCCNMLSRDKSAMSSLLAHSIYIKGSQRCAAIPFPGKFVRL